jgi:phenylalanyl-tRNA synthetase beta subunit
MEERIRDILVSAGLQDTVAYRQTSPEREARLRPENTLDPALEYVRIKNPITPTALSCAAAAWRPCWSC